MAAAPKVEFPEVLHGFAPFSHPKDRYKFGVMFYEIVDPEKGRTDKFVVHSYNMRDGSRWQGYYFPVRYGENRSNREEKFRAAREKFLERASVS